MNIVVYKRHELDPTNFINDCANEFLAEQSDIYRSQGILPKEGFIVDHHFFCPVCGYRTLIRIGELLLKDCYKCGTKYEDFSVIECIRTLLITSKGIEGGWT